MSYGISHLRGRVLRCLAVVFAVGFVSPSWAFEYEETETVQLSLGVAVQTNGNLSPPAWQDTTGTIQTMTVSWKWVYQSNNFQVGFRNVSMTGSPIKIGRMHTPSLAFTASVQFRVKRNDGTFTSWTTIPGGSDSSTVPAGELEATDNFSDSSTGGMGSGIGAAQTAEIQMRMWLRPSSGSHPHTPTLATLGTYVLNGEDTGPPTHRLKFTLTNPTEHTITYTIQPSATNPGAATETFTRTVEPGETLEFDEPVLGAGNWYVTARYQGIEYVEGLGWVTSETAETVVDNVAEGPSGAGNTNTPTKVTPPTQGGDNGTPSNPSAPPSGTSPGGTKGDEVIWKTPKGVDGVTSDEFRQGIGELVAQLKKNGKGGTGGANISMTGVESRLDDLKKTATEQKELADDEKEYRDELRQLKEDRPTGGEMEQKGQAAATAAQELVPVIEQRAYSVSKTAPNFEINMMGRDIDVNPFRSDRFGGIASFIRAAAEWLCVVGFGLWCFQQLPPMLQAMTGARQATGNAVIGGTGGQATALIAAAGITAAIAVGLVSVMAFAGQDFGAGSLLTVIGVNPLEGIPGAVAYCIDQVVPMSAVIGYMVGRLVWGFAGTAAVLGVASIVRFIVP